MSLHYDALPSQRAAGRFTWLPILNVNARSSLEVTEPIFEVGTNSIAKMRWQRTKLRGFKTDASLTPSAVLMEGHNIGDFAV